eukprot:m51a1_g5109 hypothetical protein (594) ;mRNA; r:330268-333115
MSFTSDATVNDGADEDLLGLCPPHNNKRQRVDGADVEMAPGGYVTAPEALQAPDGSAAAAAPARMSLLSSVQAPSQPAPLQQQQQQMAQGPAGMQAASPGSPGAPPSPSIGFQTGDLSPRTGDLSPRPVYQSVQEVAELQAALTQVQEYQRQVSEEYRKFVEARSEESATRVSQMLLAMRESVASAIRNLAMLWQGRVLNPPAIETMHGLLEEFTVCQRTADVHLNELQAICSNSVPQPSAIAALVLRKQQFPIVLKKNDALPEPIEVQYIVAPGFAGAGVSPLSVQMQCDSQRVMRSAVGDIVTPVAVQLEPGTTSFKLPLKFRDGTNNSAVALKFSLQLAMPGGGAATVESNVTAPFVVITHKDQFRGAAGVLLKRDCFGNALEVTWQTFANTLQRHFLMSTKQSMSSPQRPLSQYDLFYIHKTFFGERPAVTVNAFEVFWAWFGQALSTLRHQRPVLPLWMQGLVYGFANRADVDRTLNQQPPGTFLVRFSESTPGNFAVAYSCGGGTVKHYLVLPKDLNLYKTLPEFLMSRDDFINVLQLQVVREGGETNFMLTRLPKVQTFEKYLSKKHPTGVAPPASGYTNWATGMQ